MMVAYCLYAVLLHVHSVSAGCEGTTMNCESALSFEANLMVQHTAFVTPSTKRAPKTSPQAKESTQVAPTAKNWTMTKLPTAARSDADDSDDVASDDGEAGGQARGADDDDNDSVSAPAPEDEAKEKAVDGASLHWNLKIAFLLCSFGACIILCVLGACTFMSCPVTMQLFKPSTKGHLANVQTRNPQAHLPIIWPRLVKETATSQLLLPAENLTAATWCVDLYDAMGFAILRASSRYAAQGFRVIEVSSRGDGAVLLASVSSFLELRGASGNWLGRFEIISYGMCLLRDASGCPIVSIVHAGNGVQFHIASLPDGGRLTTVTRSEGSLVLPVEHFEITVAPGVDVVLILMCMLANILFRSPATHDVV